MVRMLLLLALVGLPAWAGETPFDVLTGSFGGTQSLNATCAANPHSVRFSDSNRRAHFEWQDAITDYKGETARSFDYMVLGLDGDGIILSLNGEIRLTDDGKPVVWVMRAVNSPDGYCWGRTDWPAARCIGLHLRCRGSLPVS